MKNNLFKESGLKQRFLKMLNKEGFYVAIFLCITLVATMVVYFTNNNYGEDISEDDSNVAIEQQDTSEDAQDVSKIIVEEKNEEPEIPEATKETKETNATVTQIKPAPLADPLKNLQNPVSSNEVVMAFSLGGAPVYSKTLDQYSSDHSGIDIKADIGQEVKAAADGKVIKIYQDNMLGQTIIIQHSNNIETRYSNLDEKVTVTLNQIVKAGQEIGKVGKSASFEIEDTAHVHFEIWKYGKAINPSEYL